MRTKARWDPPLLVIHAWQPALNDAWGMACRHRLCKRGVDACLDHQPAHPFLAPVHLGAEADSLIASPSLNIHHLMEQQGRSLVEHGAQVWAMHVGGESDSLIATGGADAKVTVWRDVTAEEAAKTAAVAAAGVQQQQALANALQVRPWNVFAYKLSL